MVGSPGVIVPIFLKIEAVCTFMVSHVPAGQGLQRFIHLPGSKKPEDERPERAHSNVLSLPEGAFLHFPATNVCLAGCSSPLTGPFSFV